MADPATIIALVGGIVGIVGGSGGLLTVYLAWRQGQREHRQDIWTSFKEQIASAEARGDKDEAHRVRRDYETQQEAWRATQRLRRLAPPIERLASAAEATSLTEETKRL